MSCAVTALPILILFMEKLEILRQPIGQRILRYASLDDVAIWGVLALILAGLGARGQAARLPVRLRAGERAAAPADACASPSATAGTSRIIWLAACGLGADWSGLHFMVGAFLAGAVMDAHWFDRAQMDQLRHHVLLVLMPVFFLSTGLRTNWALGGAAVFVAAAWLLLAAVAGKLIGVHVAGTRRSAGSAARPR